MSPPTVSLPFVTVSPLSLTISSTVRSFPSFVDSLNHPKWSAIKCLYNFKSRNHTRQNKTHLFLHFGHCTRTIPLVYALFENSWVDRSPQSVTVQVKVSDNRGSTRPGSACEVVVSGSSLTMSFLGLARLYWLSLRLRIDVEKWADEGTNEGAVHLGFRVHKCVLAIGFEIATD